MQNQTLPNKMRNITRVIAASLLVTLASTALAQGSSLHSLPSALQAIAEQISSAPSRPIPSAGSIETAFSPNGGAEQLIIRVIDAEKRACDVMAYSFTNPRIVNALTRAIKRGVTVRVIADHEHNTAERPNSNRRNPALAALATLRTAGAQVRTTSAFAIHHDKVLICSNNVQTGSFNYSDAAERRNSENVIVLWENPALADQYRRHFARNYATGADFQPSY